MACTIKYIYIYVHTQIHPVPMLTLRRHGISVYWMVRKWHQYQAAFMLSVIDKTQSASGVM